MSEYDRDLVVELLRQLHDAAETILQRIGPIRNVHDLTDSRAGREKLDSICMQLIAIGEGLKNLDKVTGTALLPGYPQVDWKRAKGMRDVISHQYFDVDAEVVLHTCTTHVPILRDTIARILRDLSS